MARRAIAKDLPRGSSGASLSALHTDLVREILAWLERARLPVGAAIRELPLAKTLAVSRTPVRAALLVLEKLGYVKFGPRRGFALARAVDAHATSDDELLPRSAHESLQAAIIADRVAGSLPADVSEAELIVRYSASRGAVRRVMMALSDDGVAQRLRGHGWRFAQMLESQQAIRESYEFRIVVECAALLQPGFAAAAGELDGLRKAHRDLLKASGKFDTRAWFSINSRFHEAIASWSSNRFLLDAVKRQNALRRLSEYREFHDLSPQNVKRSLRDHLDILDAVAAGDLPWAASLMRRHLELNARAYAALPQPRAARLGPG